MRRETDEATVRSITRNMPPAQEWTQRQPPGRPMYEAECVDGDGVSCAAESGSRLDTELVEEWMRRHSRATGHRRFLRICSEYVTDPDGE